MHETLIFFTNVPFFHSTLLLHRDIPILASYNRELSAEKTQSHTELNMISMESAALSQSCVSLIYDKS